MAFASSIFPISITYMSTPPRPARNMTFIIIPDFPYPPRTPAGPQQPPQFFFLAKYVLVPFFLSPTNLFQRSTHLYIEGSIQQKCICLFPVRDCTLYSYIYTHIQNVPHLSDSPIIRAHVHTKKKSARIGLVSTYCCMHIVMILCVSGLSDT